MSLAFNGLELRILNWLKDNIDSEILDVVPFEDFRKIIDAKTNLSHKYDVHKTLLALDTEGLINVYIDPANEEYTNFYITREGLIALRQRFIARA